MSPTAQPRSRRRAIAVAASAMLAGVAIAIVSWQPPETGRLLFGGYRLPAFAAIAACALIAVVAGVAAVSGRAAARVALALAAATVAWVLAELAVLLLSRHAEPAPVLGAAPLPGANLHGDTPPDIAIRWGLPHEPYRYHFRTNAWGCRNEPGRTTADVHCLGDSLLVAIQLPFEQTIPVLLERALARPVGNVSLIGKAVQEVQDLWRGLALDVRGRVVLQFVCEDNDLLDSLRVGAAGEAPRASAWDRSLARRVVLALQQLTQPVVAEAARRTADFHGTPVRFLWFHEPRPEIERQVPIVLDALRTFGAEVTAAGGHYGVVLIPAKLRVVAPACALPADFEFTPVANHVSPLPAALAQWSRTTGIPVLSPEPQLTALLAARRLPWLPDDTHLTADGHRAVAEAIAAWPWLRTVLAR